MIRGIDVYVGSGAVDWKKVKADGYDFAIIKAGQGHSLSGEYYLFADRRFAENIEGAYENGLAVGVYYYFTGDSRENSEKEADFFLSLIRPYREKITLFAVCDAENYGNQWLKKQSKEELTQNITVFCERVKADGFSPMVYTNLDHLKNYILPEKLPYPFWIASYQQNYPNPSGVSSLFWQYSEMEEADGVAGEVDGNRLLARDFVLFQTGMSAAAAAYWDDYLFADALWEKVARGLMEKASSSPVLKEADPYVYEICRLCGLEGQTAEYLKDCPQALTNFRKIYEAFLG